MGTRQKYTYVNINYESSRHESKDVLTASDLSPSTMIFSSARHALQYHTSSLPGMTLVPLLLLPLLPVILQRLLSILLLVELVEREIQQDGPFEEARHRAVEERR